MLKKIYILIVILLVITILSACMLFFERNKVHKIGMLMEDTIAHSTWDEKGLQSLKYMKEEYGVDIVYKDGMDEKQKIINTVDDFVENGVNLIYGHSNYFGKTFVEIAHLYPDVHFVYFNGSHYAENVTSIHFNSYALGFFSGMVAGKMTETNHIGAVSAYEWQTEVEGFFEGAKYENPLVDVHIDYINNWDSRDMALDLYEELASKKIDVVYPAGDFFSETIIQKASEDGIYAIGFLEDQSSIDQLSVLTSTVRDIEQTYKIVADRFIQNELDGGILTFDVEDQLVSLGTFSEKVPESYRKMLLEEVEKYKETGLLPYQR